MLLRDELEASLIFPHQLYERNPAVRKSAVVYLIEDELFFRQYPFHKHKLILHRASMKAYQHHLERNGFKTSYLEANGNQSLKEIFRSLQKDGVNTIHLVDPTDYLLERRIDRYAQSMGFRRIMHESPNFLCTNDYIHEYFNSKKRYFLTEFYIEQRKRFGILCDNGKPVGRKWTFDNENRKKLPMGIIPPERVKFESNTFVNEAKEYVSKYFASNPGSVANFNYPITTQDALKSLDDFINRYVDHYGIYQDSISTNETFLFHSVLSPALNIGLLCPERILEAVLSSKVNAPINSVEGFVRQILGWREFIRSVYVRESVFQRVNNHWNNQHKLPQSFWDGSTGIVPIDNVIQKTITHAYANHIERLMILGNFMLLCEIHPDEVYKWFMSMYIDAYDWVMVPNVYGMSQYADGGLMSTKPYISGSNYIRKMSHFKQGEWREIWDALYWCFILQHQNEFERNPRMSMMARQLKKIPESKIDHLKKIKAEFLRRFFPN